MSSIVDKRIDFIAIISVDGANPNGDPLGNNIPRTDFCGHGLISDVCIKHKLRNRLAAAMDEAGWGAGDAILISPASTPDRAESIEEKLASTQVEFQGKEVPISKILHNKHISVKDKGEALCRAYRDVRLFGFVAGSNAAADAAGKTVGITGPVSMTDARSIAPICVANMQITKCIRSAQDKKEGAGMDTIGMKHRVEHAAYVLKGGISPYDAQRTGLTWEDVEALKTAMRDMFATDASAARPAGSMGVEQVYWFTHDSKLGKIPRGKVFDAVSVIPQESAPFYAASVRTDGIPGIKMELLLPAQNQ